MMEILRSIPDIARIEQPIFLAIGVFDGVHRGHLAVLHRAIEDAECAGGVAVALTFDPHPLRILRPDRAPRLLTSTMHKAHLIEKAGVNWLLIVRFDADFAAQAPESFIRSLCESARDLRQICVGENWTFGAARAGNVTLLRKLGRELNFQVAEVAAVQVDAATVSSTRVRAAVRNGDLELARRLLGRNFTILGTVEKGAQLGRTLGYPTANVHAHNEKFPPDGVYAVRVHAAGQTLNGVANIGLRPTVEAGEGQRKLEVHLLNFDGNLYGAEIEVDFVQFLRAERKFSGIDALRTQIGNDVEAALKIFSSHP